MGRDVGSASGRGRVGGRVLRIVEGKVSHLQTVGHICGIVQITEFRWFSACWKGPSWLTRERSGRRTSQVFVSKISRVRKRRRRFRKAFEIVGTGQRTPFLFKRGLYSNRTDESKDKRVTRRTEENSATLRRWQETDRGRRQRDKRCRGSESNALTEERQEERKKGGQGEIDGCKREEGWKGRGERGRGSFLREGGREREKRERVGEGKRFSAAVGQPGQTTCGTYSLVPPSYFCLQSTCSYVHYFFCSLLSSLLCCRL